MALYGAKVPKGVPYKVKGKKTKKTKKKVKK